MIKSKAWVLDQTDLVSDRSSATSQLSLNLTESPFLCLSGQGNKSKVHKGCTAMTVAPAPAKAAVIIGKVVELGKMRRVTGKSNK